MDSTTLGDLSEELGRRLGARLRFRFRRAFEQGLGYFFFFAIFATATSIFLQLANRDGRQHYEDVRKLLAVEQLASEDQPLVTTVGAVLSSIDVSDATGLNDHACESESTACNLALALIREAAQLADLFNSGRTSSQIRFEFCQTNGCNPASPQLQLAIDAVAEEKLNLKDPGTFFSGCPYDARDAKELEVQRRNIFGLKQALCRPSASLPTTVIVPSLVTPYSLPAQLHSNDGNEKTSARPPRLRTKPVSSNKLVPSIPSRSSSLGSTYDLEPWERIEKAIMLSSALDGVLLIHQEELRELDQGSYPIGHGTIANIYFVSPDSLLRVWSPGQVYGKSAVLPTYRLWGSHPYIRRFLTAKQVTPSIEPDHYISPPYIDFVGAGIVRTYCDLLVIGRGEERFAPGVLCFDLAIQPGKIVELAHKVDDGGIVDVALLRMVGDDTFKVDDGWQTHRGDVDALMGSNDWKDYLAKGTDSSEKFQVRPVGDSGWFMLPAGRDNSVATFFALRPRGAFIQRPSYWFAVGICGAVSAVVLLVGASQSRRLSYTQGQLARLRSLQVGAIETDGSQRIVAINDRAQEILLFEGRQFGLDRGPTPLFDVIFDTGQMIRAQSMALDRPGRKAGEGPYIPTSLRDWRPEANGERLTFDDVARERARGRTSAYFVPIKRIKTEQARWVLVIASPVVGAKLTGRWRARNFASLDATFGVIEPITDQTLLYQLDQIRGNRK